MVKRKIDELNLLDDFLFQEAISRGGDGEEVCRILLSTILGRTIRKVRVIPQKPLLGADTRMHGIRMDAYIEDISDEISDDVADVEVVDAELADVQPLIERRNPDIYDMEPDKNYEKKSLPRRTRYYHAMIDSKLLDSGVDYIGMKNVVIIMILPYDPFGKNRMIYTVRNQCVEDPSVFYEDGAQKIFLYTKGTQGNPSQELRDMLKYMEKSVDDNVTNQNIAAIHQIITDVKRDKEVGIEYMKSWEIEAMIRKEGIEQGRLQERQEAILLFVESLQELGIEKEKIEKQLQEKFQLNAEQIDAYMNAFVEKTTV